MRIIDKKVYKKVYKFTHDINIFQMFFERSPSPIIISNLSNSKIKALTEINAGFSCKCVGNGKLAVKECLNKNYDISIDNLKNVLSKYVYNYEIIEQPMEEKIKVEFNDIIFKIVNELKLQKKNS